MGDTLPLDPDSTVLLGPDSHTMPTVSLLSLYIVSPEYLFLWRIKPEEMQWRYSFIL